jgi:PAS domain S-box-containing protein
MRGSGARVVADLRSLGKSELIGLLKASQEALGADSQEEERLWHDLQVHQIELELKNRELREVQAELEDLRDCYVDLYDFAPVGYLTLDRRGRMLEVNLKAAELLGRHRQGLPGHPLAERLANGQSKALLTHLRQVLAAGEAAGAPQRVELIMEPTGDQGERRTLLLESSLPPGNGAGKGRSGQCRSILLDITERKQAEMALRASEARYRTVIEMATDGFWMLDTDGRLRGVNDAYVRRSGYRREELLGMSIPDLDVTESGVEARAHIEKVMHTGSDLFETHHRTKDGVIWPAEVSTSYSGVGGGVFYAFIRDISERKRLEREILEVSTAEQERIGREIHDGIGQQLTGLGMLASGIEHRLAAAGHSGEAAGVAELQAHLQAALDEARSLARGLSPVEIDPQGLAHALSRLAEQVQAVSGVTCRYEGAWDVQVSDNVQALHLYRLAQEAVHNAVKHGAPATVVVGLKQDGDELVLTVRDDGKGIADAPERATGLGLHIMQYRAGILGGRCTFGSAAGGGTLVRCKVPLGRPHG